MNKIISLFLCAMFVCGVCGCGQSPEDITQKYTQYAVAETALNKAGFSIKEVSPGSPITTVNVFFSSPALNQSKENNDAVTGRLQVFNAANLKEPVSYKLGVGNTTVTKADGTKSQYYSPAIFITDQKTRFILVYFKGIPKSEAADLETPPMFFIIDLDKKNSRLLTEKPLLAGNLFQ